jgi:hypothetical protein
MRVTRKLSKVHLLPCVRVRGGIDRLKCQIVIFRCHLLSCQLQFISQIFRLITGFRPEVGGRGKMEEHGREGEEGENF